MDTSKLASFPLASCYRYDSLSNGSQVTLTRVLTKKSRNIKPARRDQRRMFEQTFKNIDDILRKDSGCFSEVLGNDGENYYEVAYGGYGPFHFKAKDFARLAFELSKR